MTPSTDIIAGGGPIVRTSADATALGMGFQIETTADGARRFTFVGRRCLSLNGVSPEAAMADARLLYDMILPEHRDAFAAAEAEAAQRLEAFDIEVAMRRADGEVRWHRIASMPRPQPDGRVLWDGLQIDVTERREMALALSEQRRRLEMAVEATGLGFWEWDVDAGAVTWSDRNRELFGVGPDEPINVQRYLDLVHPEDVEAVRDAFIDARDRPRGGDYSMEHRVVTPSGETRWILTTGRVTTDAEGRARLVVGTSLDISARKASEERRNLLMGELAHRAKNGIAVVMAIVAQSARGQETVEGFKELLMARLQAMADAQDLVTASGGRPVPLGVVIGKAVAPFGRARFELDPQLDALNVRGDMAIGMGLLLYEMATNAAKYGALSSRAGKVAIRTDAAGEARAAFRWQEAGGPEVRESNKAGFGTRLLKQVLRTQGGDVQFDFHPQGFHARVEFPIAGKSPG
ncbi:MAG TPA: PAS domain-containing protein [Phenylobacterium sp.]